MLAQTVSALRALDAAPGNELSFGTLLRKTDFDRRTLRLVFERLEADGIVKQTGFTLLGDIRGYRLLKPLAEVSLLCVADAVRFSPADEELPCGTAGAARYAEARSAYRRALAAIRLSEF